MLTTGKENAIVIVSVLFTPVSLGIKNLEKKIELAHIEASETAAESFSAVDTTLIENSDEKTEDTSNE